MSLNKICIKQLNKGKLRANSFNHSYSKIAIHVVPLYPLKESIEDLLGLTLTLQKLYY